MEHRIVADTEKPRNSHWPANRCCQMVAANGARAQSGQELGGGFFVGNKAIDQTAGNGGADSGNLVGTAR